MDLTKGPMGVDREVVNDGIHGEGEGVFELPLGLKHDIVNNIEGLLLT